MSMDQLHVLVPAAVYFHAGCLSACTNMNMNINKNMNMSKNKHGHKIT
jgi:hypothetical protein